MNLPLPRTRGAKVASAAVMLIGILAAAAPWLEPRRLPSPDSFLTERFRVTSSADAGPGTLREGIFAADRANRAARVELNVGRIVLESPLPPLLNPKGIVIDASQSHTQIVSRQGGDGPVLDVAAPQSTLLGLRITGAAGPAVLARAGGLKIHNVTVEDSAVGVHVVEGAGQLAVTDSLFRRNAVAIHLPGDMRHVTIQNNKFESHRDAAIWAVAPFPLPVGAPVQLEVVHNQSSGDAGPLVLVNVNARIEDNVFQDARTSAAYVSGSTTTVVRSNRMRAGRGFGIEVIGAGSGLIANNEIDHNCAGGVLIRTAHNMQIVSNRLYANGSGIVIVSGDPAHPSRVSDNFVAHHQLDGLHLIGASPLVERNHIVQNQRAGLRLSTMRSSGRTVSNSTPRLLLNILHGNSADEQVDEYVSGPAAAASPGDCAWRLGSGTSMLALQR